MQGTENMTNETTEIKSGNPICGKLHRTNDLDSTTTTKMLPSGTKWIKRGLRDIYLHKGTLLGPQFKLVD